MMNPHIRPATAGPALAARFPQMHARHAASRPDSFRAGAHKYTDAKIAALGADPEKIFRVWTDEGGPLCARRLLYLDDLGVEAGARGRAWVKGSMWR